VRQNGTAAASEDSARLREELRKTLDEDPELRQRVTELEAELKKREAELAQSQGKADKAEAELKRLAKRHESRETDLEKQFDERQAELEKQLEEIEERLDLREAEIRKQGRAQEATLRARIEELQSTLAEAQQRAIAKPAKRRGSRTKARRLSLNDATFEQLRDFGLSVTLSARVISYRDARGGFQSVDELDQIPGLSTELKRVLTDQLKLG
jgi:DNA uptake protein ComE-like DNA-binding protein